MLVQIVRQPTRCALRFVVPGTQGKRLALRRNCFEKTTGQQRQIDSAGDRRFRKRSRHFHCRRVLGYEEIGFNR
jgi:hypothetical protein